jgi:hypothetical protein
MPENKRVIENKAARAISSVNLSALNVVWIIEIIFCYLEVYLNYKLSWNDSIKQSIFLVQGLL